MTATDQSRLDERPGLTATERRIAVLTFLCLAGFAVVAALVLSGRTEALDETLLLAFRAPADPENPWGPPWFEEAAAEVTALGGYTILTMVVAIVSIALLIRKKQGATLFLVAAVASGSLISTLAKQVFERARPDLVGHLDVTFTSSFPSAHAMVSAFTWLTLAAIAVRFVDTRALKVFLLAGAVVLTVLIGISRVYLGVHWPSDVLAGWLFGGAWAGFCWLVANRFARHTQRKGALGRCE